MYAEFQGDILLYGLTCEPLVGFNEITAIGFFIADLV